MYLLRQHQRSKMRLHKTEVSGRSDTAKHTRLVDAAEYFMMHDIWPTQQASAPCEAQGAHCTTALACLAKRLTKQILAGMCSLALHTALPSRAPEHGMRLAFKGT